MNNDQTDNSNPLPEPSPALPGQSEAPLDVAQPPGEWAGPLRIIGMVVAALVAANVAFFGTCFCSYDVVRSMEGAMAAGVLAAVISGGGVLAALWPRKKT
jgi:hypothetical protein